MVSQGEKLKYYKGIESVRIWPTTKSVKFWLTKSMRESRKVLSVKSKTQNDSTPAKQQNEGSTLQKSMLPRFFSQLSLSVSWGHWLALRMVTIMKMKMWVMQKMQLWCLVLVPGERVGGWDETRSERLMDGR